MHRRAAGCIGIIIAALGVPALGQTTTPVQSLQVEGLHAMTWKSGTADIIQIQGPVHITLDNTELAGDNAVVWLTPSDTNSVFDEMHCEIVLIGNASVKHEDSLRNGAVLRVTADVQGRPRLTAEDRFARDDSASDLFRKADAVRQGNSSEQAQSANITSPAPSGLQIAGEPTTSKTTPATSNVELENAPVSFHADNVRQIETDDGKMALQLDGNVLLIQEKSNHDRVELLADHVVLFTPFASDADISKGLQIKGIEDVVTSAYLEGDVRIIYTPGNSGVLAAGNEQRLRANRVYYEFGSDRAVLTDAVIHVEDPKTPVPVIVRAQTIRQLARNDWQVDKVQLSTSEFATQSYRVAASRAYVRQVAATDDSPARTEFSAQNSTLDVFGLPIFYLPYMGGEVDNQNGALRTLQFGSSNRFGPYVRSSWGLLETFGQPATQNLDMQLRADFFGDRGPAGGIDGTYTGGYITDNTREPWNFQGNFSSYFVQDRGEDEFGGERLNVTPENDFRGAIRWEHQHFFPDGWQAQLRTAYVSDPTFLEEWRQRDWDRNVPYNTSAFIKRQRDTESLSFLLDFQPNNFVTTSDMAQEQFEVEHLPELAYNRIGDSFADDNLTFFSNNSVSALRFQRAGESLADQGYTATAQPGLPSVGQTGVTEDVTYRGDFRQEIDYPLTAGEFRVVPYVMGRATPYSDSPTDGSKTRIMAGTGIRMTTAFWKVDDAARSELLDIHRLRHVIEPELNLFTSVSTEDPQDLYIYDEQVDKVAPLSVAQIGVRQRWQTQRGSAGNWRSVDVFTLNMAGNFFSNQPDDQFLNPKGFRGTFFNSMPEASIPRNGLNVDGSWRISDTMVLLGDSAFNLEQRELATAGLGLAVSRDPRVSYFVGMRYIGQINSAIGTVAATYQLTPKYTFSLSQSYDFSQNDGMYSSFTVFRKFDRFVLNVTTYYSAVDDTSGIQFGLTPDGLDAGVTSSQVDSVTNPER